MSKDSAQTCIPALPRKQRRARPGALLLLALSLLCSPARAATVQEAEILAKGVYAEKARAAKSGGAGGACPGVLLDRVKDATAFEATLLTQFGYEFVLKGSPPGQRVILQARIHQPPGLKGEMSYSAAGMNVHEMDIPACIGQPGYAGWGFLSESELRPGDYVLELYHAGKKLASQTFQISLKPKPKTGTLSYGLTASGSGAANATAKQGPAKAAVKPGAAKAAALAEANAAKPAPASGKTASTKAASRANATVNATASATTALTTPAKPSAQPDKASQAPAKPVATAEANATAQTTKSAATAAKPPSARSTPAKSDSQANATASATPPAAKTAQASANASAQADATAPRASTYTVREGDTLLSVAKRLGVPARKLAAANNLKNKDALRIGQKLTVPKP